MKKLSLIFSLITLMSVSAQKKQSKENQFNAEQKTQLMVKKLTNKLELNTKQSAEITPLIAQQVNERLEHRKARGNKKEISSDEKYQMAMAHLDKQAALQKKMKSILNKEQYAEWKKMQHRHDKRARMHKKKAQKMMHRKSHKKHQAEIEA